MCSFFGASVTAVVTFSCLGVIFINFKDLAHSLTLESTNESVVVETQFSSALQ